MKIACAVLLLAAACGGDDTPSGSFTVAWTLSGGFGGTPTCESFQLASVKITATDTMTANTHVSTAPCAQAMATTEDIPLGSYKVQLEAIGTGGDSAGETEVMGALTKDQPDVTLASASIGVLAPQSELTEAWVLVHAGAPAACSSVPNNGVEYTVTPASGAPVTDTWDCVPGTDTAVDVPYGKLTVTAKLLGTNNQPIATSPPLDVPAFRGTGTAQATISF